MLVIRENGSCYYYVIFYKWPNLKETGIYDRTNSFGLV